MREERFPWWAGLRHGGMLIAPSRLPVYFPEEPEPVSPYLAERLRKELTRLEEAQAEEKRSFISTVLEKICGLNGISGGVWLTGGDIGTEWSYRPLSGEAVRPRRVWKGPYGAVMPVFVDEVKTLGVGHGRRTVGRVTQWLRAFNLKVALVTNYTQWRLIYAGLDHEAWVEWDTVLWFEEGKPSHQVQALKALLSPGALTPPDKDKLSPLLAAIDATRKGQAELSASLGERVRQAVELLIRSHGTALQSFPDVDPQTLYIAACRVIMRLVVILFAESRDLLPRENPIYHGSYGLQGLREDLDRHGAGAARDRLRHQVSAWPRLLALFRLIHAGSCHEDMPILRYGGALFRPGDKESTDPVLKAMSVFEDRENAPDDLTVYQILQYLCWCAVRIRQGRSTTTVNTPVDFSDLSSEYIGILYEGLLDFELRRAADEEPVIFLALGDQPALPLSRLEGMEDKALESLVEKLKKTTKDKLSGSEETEEAEEEDQEEAEDTEEEAEEEASGEVQQKAAGDTGDTDDSDIHRVVRERAVAWACRAVKAGKLVRRPRGRSADAMAAYEQEVAAMAGRVVNRVVLPGEWYLVRWGGTRKGAGTFYTRPGLAVPTVHRALRSLACVSPLGGAHGPDEDAPTAKWLPKSPEEILSLKVCDPSMGSGSFLVAALRFLVDVLFKALIHHGWIIEQEGRKLEVPDLETRPAWLKEVVSGLPDDAETAKARIQARLKRIVVERCIYGVDIDPLAVELARLSLWVETMERELPFEFLDHKLKCGNALVGCWFDIFRNYPIMAWSREGGDKNHTTGVHYEKEVWTKAIKKKRAEAIENLALTVEVGAKVYEEGEELKPDVLHEEAVALFDLLHEMPLDDHGEREKWYRENILDSPAYRKLKQAFDTWCALWFWPADELGLAPLPEGFNESDEETLVIVNRLAGEIRFLHWELEYPDVFAKEDGGFDAVLGNPPWETLQPNSKEYFSNIDPLYRAYGKQEALQVQKNIFRDRPAHERDWLLYNAFYKALANWSKQASEPFGVKGGLGRGFPYELLEKSLTHLKHGGYADTTHPFAYQGEGKQYTYKMFAELGHAILKDGGIQGIIVPSGIYTDKGSNDLRALFLDKCQWLWLFGFENRQKIFEIDSRFKFCPIIVQKGGTTYAMRTAFMRHDLSDWEEAEQHVVSYMRGQVERFSPNTKAILEVRNPKDLEILEKIYANSVLLGDQSEQGWGIKYAQGDFNMTSDSHLFKPRPWWEERDYQPDEYGRWIGPDGDMALPLYEGRMIGQFDFSEKGWVSGKGRSAVWRDIPWEKKQVEPQYLMSLSIFREHFPAHPWKLLMMSIGSATNKRSMICSICADWPANHSLAVLSLDRNLEALSLCAWLGSYAFDYALRLRLGGLNISWFVLEESPLPKEKLCLDRFVASLVHGYYPGMAPIGLVAKPLHAALTDHERLRLRCIIDALVSEIYGLDFDDLEWVFHDCDHPSSSYNDHGFYRTLDPKGFWRVDKEKDPELRQTVLTLIAFHDLKAMIKSHGNDRNKGIEAFCNQNNGEGWMIPETVCLADYGLGYDERAKSPQPVLSRMGERYLPWQLEQTVEESWAECERHARNILGEKGFAKLMAEIENEKSDLTAQETPPVYLKAAEEPEYVYDKEGKDPNQGKLFRTKPVQDTLFDHDGPETPYKKKD